MTWDGKGIDPWLPDRLGAELAITTAERRLYNSWLGSIGRWLTKAKRAVLATEQIIDAAAVFAEEPEWAAEMQAFLDGPVLDVMGQVYRQLFGSGFAYDNRPAVVDHLAGVRNRMVRTPDEVYNLIAGEVAHGAAVGSSIDDIAGRVDDILSVTGTERWRNRAVTVARTETVAALNAGRTDAFAQVAADTGDAMEQMWLCVAPDTPVAATGVVAAARRHYKGPLIRVATASGSAVALTPEHRVLTGRGWLPAKAVNEGDHLVKVVAVDAPVAPHVQHTPPKLGQLVDAAIQAKPVQVRTVPVAVNLHVETPHGHIEVVPVDRGLADRLQAGVPEGCEDLFLTRADRLGPVEVLADRAAPGGSRADRLAGAGRPDGGHPPFLDRLSDGPAPGHADLSRGALGAHGDAGGGQQPDDDVGAAPVLHAEHPRAGALQVAGHDRVSVDVVAAAGGDAEPLRGTRLLDRLRPESKPQPYRVGRAEQFAAFPEPPPQGLGADRKRGGHLRRCLTGPVTPNDVVEVDDERAGVVAERVSAVVGEDRRDAFTAEAEGAGDTPGPLPGVEQAQHFSNDVRVPRPGLAGRGPVPQHNASRREPGPDSPRGDAVLGRQTENGRPGLVARDEVVQVDVVPWDAHVYDLSTVSGWFLADGLIVHNSTIDARTRPAHAVADQQRVPLGQPFTVGGASLRFPGDPSGPAAMVINCRCVTILLRPGEDVDLTNRQYTEDDWDAWHEAQAAANQDGQTLPDPPPRDLETEARQRQARIDTARAAGGAAAELDEVAADLGDDLGPDGIRALETRINAQVARGAIDPDTADRIRKGLADGGVDGMSTAAWEAAHAAGARRVGDPGSVTRFDRKLHQPVPGAPIRAGEPAFVVRPGVRWADEDLVIDRAVVDEADAGDLFDFRARDAAAEQDALGSVLAALDRKPRGGVTLTSGQRSALRDYESAYGAGLNGVLRQGRLADASALARRTVGHIDAVMAQAPLPRDLTVWRGIAQGQKLFGPRLSRNLTGFEWQERAYSSTTASVKVAKSFTYPGAHDDSGEVLMRLLVPRGTGAVRISGMESGQAELLLERGLRMRVVRDRGVIDGVRHVDVEVIR